jgi:hypothetical protein
MCRADRAVFEPTRVTARLMLPKRLTFSKCSGTHGRSNLTAPTPLLPAAWCSWCGSLRRVLLVRRLGRAPRFDRFDRRDRIEQLGKRRRFEE